MSRLEKAVMAAIVMLVLFLVWSSWYQAAVEKPKAYAAWVKQTGNPKQLTYDEWKSLHNASKDHDPVFIFIPH